MEKEGFGRNNVIVPIEADENRHAQIKSTTGRKLDEWKRGICFASLLTGLVVGAVGIPIALCLIFSGEQCRRVKRY